MGNCTPTSSNCIIWQGPDIPCIGLCEGDTITDIIYKLATEFCELLDQLNVNNFDISCIISPDGSDNSPLNIEELLVLMIAKICELQDTVGSQGSQGERGLTGDTGPQGPAGPTGPQGIQGATGPQGIQGNTGSQGPAGPVGPIGPQGATGPQGSPGLPGPQGIQGEPGECDCCEEFRIHIVESADPPTPGYDNKYTANVVGGVPPFIWAWSIHSGPINNIFGSVIAIPSRFGIQATNPKLACGLIKLELVDSKGCRAYDSYLYVNFQQLIP
jgi:hypothetical protein